MNPTGLDEKPLPDTASSRPENPSPLELRNLCRADWRVLLAVPPLGFENMALLGGSSGLSSALVELGVARHVSRKLPCGAAADAVAILQDARISCEDVASSLAPGGTLYWEIEARAGAAASIKERIERRLRRLGLTPTGFYWVRPNFETGAVFVPLDLRNALEWYLGTLGAASRGFLSLVIPRFAKWAANVAMIAGPVRHCAVTAVAGRVAIPSILSHPAVPPALRGDWTRPLVMTQAGSDASRRLIVLPFAPDFVEPSLVLKFSRFPKRNADVEKEQKIAAEIRSRLDASMRRSIPEPLGTFAWGGALVAAEAYAGKPLSSRAGSSTPRRIESLRLVERWLAEFHRQTQASHDPFSASQIRSWVDRPIDAYRGAFRTTPGEEKLFQKVRERAGLLLGRPFPMVWSHPAFSEANICQSRDRIGVVDWEAAGLGPPLRDLIYFVTLWYHRTINEKGSGEARVQSFRELFFPSTRNRLQQLASETLEEHMRNLQIDSRFLPMMLVLTWVTHALGRLKRVRDFGEPQENNREGNLHVALLEICAANQDRLFGEEKS